jgi:hypothetical protein
VRTRALAAAAPLVLTLLLTGCGSAAGDERSGETSGEQDREAAAERAGESGLGTTADRGTCRADAEPLARPYGDGFPEQWRFPPRTTAFAYEDAGAAGVVVTAVSATPFRDVLDFLNHDAVQAGFRITDGETEEHDAEASWTGGQHDGRWTIRESGSCPGETVIQVLAYPAG